MTEELTIIRNLKEFNKRYNIDVTVASTRKDIPITERQEGSLNDESGEIRFIVWRDSGHRYLKEGKRYLLKDVTIFNYKGTLQVHVDKESKVTAGEYNVLKHELEDIQNEKKDLVRQRGELDHKSKDIELQMKKIKEHQDEAHKSIRIMETKAEELSRHKAALHKQLKNFEVEKKNIESDRSKTLESIKYLENKKHEIQHDKYLAVFGYVLFLVLIVAGGLYIYDFTLHMVIPKVNDIIEVAFDSQRVPYKVVTYDKEEKVVTLESIDEYKEKIAFRKPMNLKKIKKESTENLKKYVKSEKTKIYSYNIPKNKEPLSYVTPVERTPVKKVLLTTKPSKYSVTEVKKRKPRKSMQQVSEDIKAQVIHVNSEKNRTILISLPGIGPHRVNELIKNRPYYSVMDVMDAKIGIGAYWAEQWKEQIKAGLLKFD